MRQAPVTLVAGASLAMMLLALLAACGGSSPDGSDGSGGAGGANGPAVQPLAKTDDWRPGLAQDLGFGVLEIAYDRETADRAWQENVPGDLPERDGQPAEPGRYGDLGSVDFDTHAIVVWSSGQSGSCPGWLADIRTGADGTVELETGVDMRGGNACTDDYQPYRMLLAVERDRLPGPDQLPVTTVIVDGRSSGAGSLVAAYPADA